MLGFLVVISSQWSTSRIPASRPWRGRWLAAIRCAASRAIKTCTAGPVPRRARRRAGGPRAVEVSLVEFGCLGEGPGRFLEGAGLVQRNPEDGPTCCNCWRAGALPAELVLGIAAPQIKFGR